LSNARAQAIYEALVAKGVDAKRLMVSGQGPNEPLVSNRTAADRARNNRVEIVFLYH
jgi:flagellar motor protein MotB